MTLSICDGMDKDVKSLAFGDRYSKRETVSFVRM
ncbi:hypothetical protein T10_1559 [Trichinella papuae]|uniref:Uncharacterized protein n=1 Tax=Trichinella papuae TaxID=268474 RepID=A0A0V1LWL7_9BILA|nr:hypothetical protein T10_1559 [Trichinella papuae]